VPLHRVYGPPGCGKTTYLRRQALLAADRYGERSVMVASLTRAAAHEVAGRIPTFPPQNIGTLHSFAYRGLDKPALAETPDGIKAWNADAPPHLRLDATSRDTDYPDIEPMPTTSGATAADLHSAYGILRARRADRSTYPPDVERFATRWEDWKRQTGRLDFSDLIDIAADELDAAPGDPAVFMVDEAQDMSAAEMRLVHRWGAAAGHLVIVGDPDQNLYEWRGSDPGEFARGDAESEHILKQTYRVPELAHAFAVDWIERTHGRRPIAYRPTSVRGDLARYGVQYRDRGGVATLIDRCAASAEEGRTSMILASCGFMLNPIAAQMRADGVPFHNPYRPTHGGWNPLRGARRLLSLLRGDEAAWGREAAEWAWKDVWSFVEPMRAEWFDRGGKALIERRAGRDRFGNEDAASAAIGDDGMRLLHDLLTPEAFGAVVSGDVSWWEASLLASWRPKVAYACEVARRRGAASLREEPRVVLGTIHSVKGGEADDVFVFPDLSDAAMKEWTGRESQRAAIRRLFYVAFTRTRGGLYLCAPSSPRAVRLPPPPNI
jgi:superfamily I DNA/RNA helicase